ncbi:MAG: AI-2E family transporter, partial [Mycobacterium sp.]
MNQEFTLTQRRALAVFTVIALLFGAYFLRGYFVLIVVAAVGAYMFTPLFRQFSRRLPTGLSASFTLLAALAVVFVPVGLCVFFAVLQISRIAAHVAEWVQKTDLTTLGDKALDFVNDLLARVPFIHTQVTMESLRHAMVTVAQKGGEMLLHLLQGAVGGVVGAITSAVIFLYVF